GRALRAAAPAAERPPPALGIWGLPGPWRAVWLCRAVASTRTGRRAAPTPAGPWRCNRSPAALAVTLVAAVVWVMSPRVPSATPAPSTAATSSTVCGPAPDGTVWPPGEGAGAPGSEGGGAAGGGAGARGGGD